MTLSPPIFLFFGGRPRQVDGVAGSYLGDGRDERGDLKETDLPLYIGGAGDREFFKGAVDEVRIYSRVLTADDVLALYRLKETSKCVDTRTLGTFAKPATSCNAILQSGAVQQGVSTYWLSSGADKFQVDCDFATDGGGTLRA